MIKRLLVTVIGSMAIGMACLSAQTVSGSQDYTSGFSTLEVSDYFTAKVVYDDYYGAEWNIESDLKEAMHVYLRGDVLVATLDRKALSNEAKKKYSGKKVSSAVISVTVHTPDLRALRASGNAVVDMSGYRVDTSEMVIELSDDAVLKGLDVKSSALTLTASKKARVESAVVEADNLSVNTNNSAYVRIDHECRMVSVQANGTSDLSLSGRCESMDVTALNSAKLRLDGSVISLNLKAGCRELHADGLSANDAIVTGSNACKAEINVSDNLSLELKGGCQIVFAGDPVIKIVSIQNSSVSHSTL